MIVSSSRVVFFLCTCLAALPLFSSMFCEKAVTERWTHGRRFPQRGTKPQAFVFSGTLEVRTDLLTTPWRLYGLALWGWPVPHRTNLWSAAGKAAALIWTAVHVWKDWGPVPIFFYQLSIAIWRTTAWPGTLPTVAHCIQVMVIFFIELSDAWICLSSSCRISTRSAQASQTASSPGAQIKDLCFLPHAKRPRRSSHR